MRKSGLRVREALVILLELGQQDDVVPPRQFANSLLAIWEVRSGLGKCAFAASAAATGDQRPEGAWLRYRALAWKE